MSMRRRRGFTLIEVIVVLAILAIVAGVALPVASTVIARSKMEETRNEMRALVPALQNYFWDCRRLPATLSQLQTNSPSVSGWRGPYVLPLLSAKPGANLAIHQDAWNEPYQLSTEVTNTTWNPTTSTNQVVVRSKGPDFTLNTADDLTQIVNILFMRRKETVDELNIINSAIQAYNAQYLATAPLPTHNEALFLALNNAGLLPRPASGADPLRSDGWGTNYAATPSGVTPVVRVTSSNLTGAATPPPGN